MAINVNWADLRQTFKSNISQSESIIVHYLPRGASGTIKKKIRGDEFLNFVWLLSDKQSPAIAKLIVTDLNGKVLYNHPEINVSNEVIPGGDIGNPFLIPVWNNLDAGSKEFWMGIMLAQIEYETKHAEEFRTEQVD
jgi:hypothetical protein